MESPEIKCQNKNFIPGFMLIKVNIFIHFEHLLLLNAIFAYHLVEKEIESRYD